jgi:hypothetical protein
MTMQVRRVVTGHDENGNAVVVSDERLAAVSRGVGTGISGCAMWSTNRMPIDNSAVRVRPPVSLRGTRVGLDVHALSVVAHAVDEVTGEVSRARLCPDHGEIFCWLSLVRAPVRVVYEAGSHGGCSGGAGSCDPIQISVHVGARGAGCSPDGVGG